MTLKKIIWGIEDDMPEDIELDEKTKKLLKGKFKEILKNAKDEFDRIEQEWSNYKITSEDVSYFIENEEQDEVEPTQLETRRKPKPYRSYSECVVDQIEKEMKNL